MDALYQLSYDGEKKKEPENRGMEVQPHTDPSRDPVRAACVQRAAPAA